MTEQPLPAPAGMPEPCKIAKFEYVRLGEDWSCLNCGRDIYMVAWCGTCPYTDPPPAGSWFIYKTKQRPNWTHPSGGCTEPTAEQGSLGVRHVGEYGLRQSETVEEVKVLVEAA